MFKQILTFCIFASLAFLAKSAEKKQVIFDSETLQKALSSLPEKDLPEKFKKTIKEDGSHWCCKIDLPIVNIPQTRVISYTILNSGNHRCGYTSCGFLGWSSCTKWCHAYWEETKYQVETYTITKQDECPKEHIVCCKDHFLIMDHCFHIDEIQNNLDLLTALNNTGIVLPGIGK